MLFPSSLAWQQKGINFKKTVCQYKKMHILSSLRSKRLESSFARKLQREQKTAKNVPSSFNKLARPETLAFPLATQAVIRQLRNVISRKNPFETISAER